MNMFGRFLPVLAVLVIASPVSAQITTFSSRAGLVSAVRGPLWTETFQSCGGTLGLNEPLRAGDPFLKCESINTTTTFRPQSGGNLFFVGLNTTVAPWKSLGFNGPSGGFIEVSFAPSTRAFGANFFQNMGNLTPSGSDQPFLAVVLGAGGVQLGAFNFNIASGTGGGFFGFTSPQDVAAVRVSQTSGFVVMNNVMFISPEPSTWVMMVAGLGALGVAARRRRSV